MEIRDVLTNIKKYDAWDYKNYPLRKEEADAIIENYKEPCEDCISRKQALIEIKAIMRGEPMLLKSLHRKKWEEETAQYRECMEIIKRMPSVQPIRPKGKWIDSDIPSEKYVCSNCGGACWYYDYEGDVAKSRFCPNCGASMKGET